MLIAIPSKGRPFKSPSKELLKRAVLYVPEYEADEYRKIYSEVVAVPNDVKGITPTRNWILKSTDEKRVVFIDDDMKVQGRFVLKPDGYGLKHQKMTEEEWIREFERLFDVVESMGWKIFGVNTEGNKISYKVSKPLILKGYVLASCMGIVNDGTMYFDETYKVKEDYEISLRHIEEFGGILRARWLCWENSHWNDGGGCKDYRSDSMEREMINKLIKRYPRYIRAVSNKSSQYTIKLQFG